MESVRGRSYAKNVLQKYGWTEGKGLGKNESGMVEALKPKLKFDTTGIGHDHAEQFTFNWWEVAFNEAAKRVSVSTSRRSSEGQWETNDRCISTKRPLVTRLRKENTLMYGTFIKTETLKNGGEIVPVKRKSSTHDEDDSSHAALLSTLSDDELFKICGGRTAHKAARHGHKLVGKLARVIEQEKEQLSSLGVSGKEEGANMELETQVNLVADFRERKKKEKKRKREVQDVEDHKNTDDTQCATDTDGLEPSTIVTGVDVDGLSKGRKKEKKEKRSKCRRNFPENEYVEVTKRKKRRGKSECEYLNDTKSALMIEVVNKAVCEDHNERRKKKKGHDH